MHRIPDESAFVTELRANIPNEPAHTTQRARGARGARGRRGARGARGGSVAAGRGPAHGHEPDQPRRRGRTNSTRGKRKRKTRGMEWLLLGEGTSRTGHV